MSTDVGGTPDRVINGKTGYLVKPGDVKGLAELVVEDVESGLVGAPKPRSGAWLPGSGTCQRLPLV